MQKQIISQELKDAGFQVSNFSNGILVSLKNRKVSTLEVSTVLFDNLEIQVGMTSVDQGVFIGTVTW